MHQQAGALLARMQHSGEPVTLIMVDADHFKRINDEFGHQTGDAVLCHLVNRISQHLRNRDLLGRFGGEEFTLLLPARQRTGQTCRRAYSHGISQAPWRLAGETISLTASLGVACSQHHGYDFNTLLGAADAALYRAKTLGRNRVELAPPPGQTDQEQVALRLLSQFSHNLDV
ncbi:GGDEF domain-containing protein [Halopseudomonas pachastrellae]|nr:GGDEF domain-containing protein [Halopseudomonas pachastrellae]